MRTVLILATLLALLGAAVPVADASRVTCTTVAPAGLSCEGIVYFASTGSTALASLKMNVAAVNATGTFDRVLVDLFPRLTVNPPTYGPSAWTCTATQDEPRKCDVTLAAASGSAYLLVAEIFAPGNGSPVGPWGWEWKLAS